MLELNPERVGQSELPYQDILICGTSLVADMSGALFWPSQRAVVVSDLAFGAQGQGSAGGASEALQQIASVIDRYDATCVIALGDGGIGGDRGRAHDGSAEMHDEDHKTLSIIQEHCKWLWICDGPSTSPGMLGGETRAAFIAEGLTLVHRPTRGLATHEIGGALRPAARISRHGHEIRRPCFVTDGLRIVLPAFSTFVGGENILGNAFEPMFGSNGMSIFMLGHDGLIPIAARLLRAD